ncbi:hypothetical protein IW144_006344, partial [Coemansia sp. RSA 522]
QGIVTVFSGNQEPPPLDPDLDALNKLPKYRPLVLAPSSNRLSGIFHLGARYIEPTAERKCQLITIKTVNGPCVITGLHIPATN